MKKIIYYFILLFAVFGCTHEADFPDTGVIQEGEPAKVTFEFHIPQSTTETVTTRSAKTESETDIKELDIIIVSEGVIVEHAKVGASDIIDSQTSINNKTATVRLTQRIGCDMYIYANASNLITEGITLDELNTIEDTYLPSELPLRMGGELTNINIPASGQFEITLLPDVAKISVNTGGCEECKLEEDINLKANFVIGKLHLFNAADKGLLTRTGYNHIPKTVTYSSNFGDLNPDALIYTYEASEENTYLIVEAKYKDFETSYYKIDLYDQVNKTMFAIMRNHHYKVFVRKVSGNGYSNIDDAKKYPSSNIMYEIVDQKSEIFDMITNGQYELGVADKLEVPSSTSNPQTVVLLNSAPNNDLHPDLQVEYESSSSWLKNVILTMPPEGDNKSKIYTFSFKIEANQTSVEREGYIVFKAGNLRKKFFIKQAGVDFILDQLVEVKLPDNNSYIDYWDFLKKNVDGITPDEMKEVRNRGLHFMMNNNILKYRIEIKNGTCAPNAFTQSNTSRFSTTQSGNIFEITSNNTETDPWIENLVITVTDEVGSHEEHYAIYRTGILHKNSNKYLVGTHIDAGNPKEYSYYEVVKIGNNYWLDRNLGASSNGFYTISTNTHESQNANAIGGYYKIREKDNKDPFPDLCPDGFRVPTQEELNDLSTNGALSMEMRETSVAEMYWVPMVITNNSKLSLVYLSLGGYMQTGVYNPQGDGGYYWCSTYAEYYEQDNFNNVGSESRCWQRRLQIRNSSSTLMQFLPDRMANGSGGNLGDKYKGMLIRCIKN